MIVLDGAMGTSLLAQGLPPGTPPEAWLFERPDAIAAVHSAHRAAGAEIVLTCTFNLASPRLALPGRSVEELASMAVALARRAAPGARVAGALGPAWAPGPGDDSEAAYARAAVALAAAGADLLWLETLPSAGEAALALAATRRSALPAVATFTFQERNGELVDAAGEAAAACLALVAERGAVAVGSNCALPGTPLAAALAEIAPRLHVPLVAKPSAGLPGELASPDAFGRWAADLARAGASWVGGCCGTTAAHLAAAVDALRRH